MPGSVLHDPGSQEPVFFLSYAHVRQADGDEERDPDGAVMRFFYDLSAHMNQLIDRNTGVDAGAMDRTMGGSERWTDDLLQGLGTCHVFVALTSPRYFNSEWCGREWGAFEARLHDPDGGPAPIETAIVPVRWVPTIRDQTPVVSQAIQEFSTPAGRERNLYKENGLYGLLEGGQVDVYKYIVWRLARRVATLYYSTAIPKRIPPSAKDLPNVFLREAL